MVKIAKIGKRYQIVLPKSIREQVELKPDDELIVSVKEGKIIMMPKVKRYSKYMRGLGKEIWKGIDATKYVRAERDSWKK